MTQVAVPKDKLAPRGLACVFLGYPYGKKGYRVMDIQSRKCYNSRDVYFVDDVYPFLTLQSSSNNSLFPSLTFIADDTPLSIIWTSDDLSQHNESHPSVSYLHQQNESHHSFLKSKTPVTSTTDLSIAPRPQRTKLFLRSLMIIQGFPLDSLPMLILLLLIQVITSTLYTNICHVTLSNHHILLL